MILCGCGQRIRKHRDVNYDNNLLENHRVIFYGDMVEKNKNGKRILL